MNLTAISNRAHGQPSARPEKNTDGIGAFRALLHAGAGEGGPR